MTGVYCFWVILWFCNPSAIVPKSPLNSSHSVQWALEQHLEPSGTEADFPKKLDAALPFSEPLTSTQLLEDPGSSAVDSSWKKKRLLVWDNIKYSCSECWESSSKSLCMCAHILNFEWRLQTTCTGCLAFSPWVSELQCGKMEPQIQEVTRKWDSELKRNLKWKRENIWQIKRGQNVPGVKDSMRDNAEMSRRGRNLKCRETCKLLTLKSQRCSLLLNLPLFLEEWGHCIRKFPRTTAQNRKIQLKYTGLLH